MSDNRYGLDSDYLTKNFNLLLRDIGNYKPDEMYRVLTVLRSAINNVSDNVIADQRSEVLDEAIEAIKSVQPNNTHTRRITIKAVEDLKQ